MRPNFNRRAWVCFDWCGASKRHGCVGTRCVVLFRPLLSVSCELLDAKIKARVECVRETALQRSRYLKWHEARLARLLQTTSEGFFDWRCHIVKNYKIRIEIYD